LSSVETFPLAVLGRLRLNLVVRSWASCLVENGSILYFMKKLWISRWSFLWNSFFRLF